METSTSREEVLICHCGRVKFFGHEWQYVTQWLMVKIFTKRCVSYAICVHCKERE